MKGLGRAVAMTAGMGLLVAGCAAASHLNALQPPSAPRSPNLVIPQAAQPRPRIQLGIDVDVYHPGQDIAAAAATDMHYIRSLHANSVSVSFPFFMTGRRADKVKASSPTPTPAQLGTIVEAAVHAGFYVSVRPLLDETSLRNPGPNGSRSTRRHGFAATGTSFSRTPRWPSGTTCRNSSSAPSSTASPRAVLE